MAQQRDPGEPRSRAVVATTAVLGRLREGSTEDPPIVRDTSWRQLSASVKSSSKLRALGAACPATPAGLRPKPRRQGDAEAVVRRTQVAISSGVYSLVGVLIGGGIATASQVHLEQGRERHRQRADERLLRASKRERLPPSCSTLQWRPERSRARAKRTRITDTYSGGRNNETGALRCLHKAPMRRSGSHTSSQTGQVTRSSAATRDRGVLRS